MSPAMSSAMSTAMSRGPLIQEPVNAPAVVLSVLVHTLLFAFLFFGIRWHSKLPDAVSVELWVQPPVLEQPARPKSEPRPEPKPKPKVVPKVEPEPEPTPEVLPPKPDIALEKPKVPPPKKVVAKKVVPKKVMPKKVVPKKEKPSILKFNRAEAIQKEAERDLERVSPPKRPVQPRSGGPVADNSYVNKIKNKVRSNVVLPAGIAGNPEAIFHVVQLPSGDVISAQLRKSSGHRAYDEAVERAILKSSPLPRPDRANQFARELQLKFRPVE